MSYYNYSHLDNQDNAMKVANCTDSAWYSFEKEMNQKLWQVDALLFVSAIMAGVTVGIGAYGQWYRHHPITHLIFIGSTTLFLPIISSVVTSSTGYGSSISSRDPSEFLDSVPALIAMCSPSRHSVLVIMWALLVQNVMINTSVVVAVDEREGASIGPPLELLAQGAWTFYLGISFLNSLYKVPNYYFVFEVLPFLLTLAKLLFKYYAFQKARQSFSLGRNPRLVAGYMQHLSPSEHAPLLVMGEEARHVEKNPHGYMFGGSSGTMLQNTNGLVTIDRVWQLLDSPNSNSMPLPVPTPQRLKDLCLSFALFKLLRCRFSRYELHSYDSSQSTSNFFWSLLLRDGEHTDRVFRVIADELSFLRDYYNSSLPISYSMSWLPVVGIIISLFSISYCIVLGVWLIIRILVVWIGSYLHNTKYSTGWALRQIICDIRCKDGEHAAPVHFGNIFFDMVPLSLLLVFLVAAEVRDIVSYVCSNWTKVVLTCRLFPNSEQSLSKYKWLFVHVLRWRCKLIEHQWDDRIGQCSVLPLRPRTNPLALFRHHLQLPDHKITADASMKVSIINALIRSNTNDGIHLSNGKASLYRSGEGGERFLWACNSISVANHILIWQIATSILEVRYPLQLQQAASSSVTSDGDRAVATYLSRYCTYLVFCCPELLPDDKAWSKSMYDTVKKDADNALARPCRIVARHYLSRSVSTLGYQQLVDLLSANSKHQVLKDGVKLGKQLVETISDQEAAWKLLASFWSEMILYIAPSDNLKGHEVAIARGGELITLLWALLYHVGIVSRTISDDAAMAAAGTSTAGVV